MQSLGCSLQSMSTKMLNTENQLVEGYYFYALQTNFSFVSIDEYNLFFSFH